jgi:hypothetical protein
MKDPLRKNHLGFSLGPSRIMSMLILLSLATKSYFGGTYSEVVLATLYPHSGVKQPFVEKKLILYILYFNS